MKQELQPLIIELCHLAVTRNAINTRRHRARWRKNYYANAVRVVEAHNNSNYILRHLRHQLEHTSVNTVNGVHDCAKIQSQIKVIETSMQAIRDKYINHKKPLKWQVVGLHKLRSLVLQGEGEYAMAKHETMEFSIKHRARVRHITTALNCSLSYNNGSLTGILIKNSLDLITYRFDLKEIHQYAEQYELNKAVESMLQR